MKVKELRSDDKSVEQNFNKMDMTTLRTFRQDSRRTRSDIGVEIELSSTACWMTNLQPSRRNDRRRGAGCAKSAARAARSRLRRPSGGAGFPDLFALV